MKTTFTQTLFYPVFITLLIFNNSMAAQTAIMSTAAGGGTQNAGAGVPADSANIGLLAGVAVDADGNIYIATPDANSIFRVDHSSNMMTVFAGGANGGFGGDGGLADTAKLAGPVGVGVDGSGNVYIADNGNDRIRKVDIASGIISTIAGTGIPGFSGDNGPATAAKLNGPSDVAVDAAGNVYIADRQNNRIRKITAGTGIISTFAGSGPANSSSGFSGDNGPADAAKLAQPNSVTVDGFGNVYIADLSNNRIRKVSNGIITTIAGSGPGESTGGFSGDGGLADTCMMYYPRGVAVDVAGNIYFTDSQNSRVRKVNVSTGIITTVAGSGNPGFAGDGGPADSAEINGADNGLAVDQRGNIYIADVYNARVRKVTVAPTSVINLQAEKMVSVYPNPAENQLVIENVPAGSPVIVTNTLGQHVLFTTATGNKAMLNISSLAAGLYSVNGAKFLKQ